MKNWARGTSHEEWLQQHLNAYCSITCPTRDTFWNKLYFEYFQQYPWNLRDNYEPPGSTCADPQKVAPPCLSPNSGVDLHSGPWHSFEPEPGDKVGLEVKEKSIEAKKHISAPIQAHLHRILVPPTHISSKPAIAKLDETSW